MQPQNDPLVQPDANDNQNENETDESSEEAGPEEMVMVLFSFQYSKNALI